MSKKIYLFSTSVHPDVENINSLKIKFLKPIINFSRYDYLIITSKQAIKALSQYDKKDFINIPALCVSKKTATAYEDFGGKVFEIGDGYGDNLVKIIKQKPKEKRYLYLRAEVVASDFVSTCKDDGYSIDEEILYVSECSSEILNISTCRDATLIFTSPSAIKCYIKNHEITDENRVIVIGKTTALALPTNINYEISQITSIDSCIELGLK